MSIFYPYDFYHSEVTCTSRVVDYVSVTNLHDDRVSRSVVGVRREGKVFLRLHISLKHNPVSRPWPPVLKSVEYIVRKVRKFFQKRTKKLVRFYWTVIFLHEEEVSLCLRETPTVVEKVSLLEGQSSLRVSSVLDRVCRNSDLRRPEDSVEELKLFLIPWMGRQWKSW